MCGIYTITCKINGRKYVRSTDDNKERWGKQYRYYIPEEYADELDSLFRINRKKHTFEIVYKYKRGIKPMAKQLLIDGLPWMETIKE